jgi:acyl transferase domain-containing protein
MNNDNNGFRPGLEVAVIGMSGRFPGANSIERFWNNLVNGVQSIKFFTEEELLEAGFEPEVVNDPEYVRAKGII